MRGATLLMALLVAACGGSVDPGGVMEDRPLHGGAAAIAPFLGPIAPDSLTLVSDTFDPLFEPLGMLTLSSEGTLLGDVFDMQVSADGRILVHSRGGVLSLFDSDGSFIRDLSPERCFPGHEWTITHVGFFGDGDIFVAAGPHAPLLFDADGACRGAWDGPRFADMTAPSQDGLIHQYFPVSDSTNLFVHDASGNQVESWSVEVALPRLTRRVAGGGLVALPDGSAILSLSSEARFRRFDPGMPGRWISDVPDYFRELDEDMDEVRGLQALMEALRKLPPRSTTRDFGLFDHDRLYQVIYNNYERAGDRSRLSALRIMDLQGREVHDGPIFPGLAYFASAGDGVLYRAVPPSPDGNPGLILYRFKG